MNIDKAGSSLHTIKTMAAEVSAWLFTITIYLCVITPCLAQSKSVGSKVTIDLLFWKGKGRSSYTKLKQKMLCLLSFYQDLVFTFAVISFTSTHSQTLFFKTFFSLFCKVFCGVLHWLCLILWTVFSFFSCAHKWLLTDCTNCTESTCCFLFCNTSALMMSHPSICFTFNSVQASWGISVGACRGGSLKGLTHGNVTFVCHSFGS